MFEWLWRPQTIQVTPLAAFGVAAVLALVVVVSSRLMAPATESEMPTTAAVSELGQTVQFVFVAPEAASVAVVGDFNDWNAGATPLVQTSLCDPLRAPTCCVPPVIRLCDSVST